MPGPRVRKGENARLRARHAMIHNAAKTLQNIMFDGAAGKTEAYGPALRVLELTQDAMQPAKDEQKGGSSGPIMPRFELGPSGAAPQATPENDQPLGTIVDAEGNVYMEA